MSLSNAERSLLMRRLAGRRRRPATAAGLVGLVVAGVLLLPAVPAAAGLLGAAVAYPLLSRELQQDVREIKGLHDRALVETSHVYDRSGVLLREMFTGGRRTYMPLDQIPETVRQATISVEDKTFYENPGVDVTGILRAVVGEVTSRPNMGGGSTITQQFVRNAVFTYEERSTRSYSRKAKEILLALILTRQETKDQILEWYLNEVFYGNLAFGIEAAAQTIFGKPATELDLAESALLAGLPQLPGQLDPLSPDPDVQRAVRHRQRVVLNLMAENGYITAEEAGEAADKELSYAQPDTEERFLAPHFTVYVEQALEDLLGPERLALGGLEVTTTVDLGLQQLAEQEVADQVDKLRDTYHMTNAALVALEPSTGQILAMVGSVDYWNVTDIDGRVNVVVRERQPGSSIKPITYLTALEQGMPTSQVLWDVPMEMYIPEKYEPRNYDGEFHGPVRLRAALANSYNIPALKLLGKITPGKKLLDQSPEAENKAGVELAIDTAHRMGINGLQRDPWEYGLSLTLGGGEVTLLDLTTAYATIANQGVLVRPRAILRVTDATGKVVYDIADEIAGQSTEPVVDPRAAYIVTDILSDNEARTPAFGASSPLKLGVPAAVKTGTTNDSRDNWTLGFTPYLVAGVWAGNNDNTPMRNTSGVTGAAPIWNAFMRNVVSDADRRAVVDNLLADVGRTLRTEFERPDGIVEASVCRLQSLNRMGATCLEYDKELFLKESVPTGSGVAEAGVVAQAQAAGAQVTGPLSATVGSGVGGDWTVASAAVVPLPGPPPEAQAAAQAEGKALKWPPALLCQAAADGFGADKTQPVAVLPLPVDVEGGALGEERRFVLQWAAENGWSALEPTQVCTPEMVQAALERGALPGYTDGLLDPLALLLGAGNEYRLGLAPGSLLAARTVLTGTVRYNPADIEYYKVELGRGQQPREWITLGDVHRGAVVDGPIEVLDAPSLPSDDYVVRLVLVKKDGNFLQPPYSVPIRISH